MFNSLLWISISLYRSVYKSFNDISFTYDREGKINHLENINFAFKRKQKIALVGESGSGKSTILSLIRGLYKIEKGEVYCNGEPLLGKVDCIKDNVTLIPQEPEIFNKLIGLPEFTTLSNCFKIVPKFTFWEARFILFSLVS